MTTLDSTKIMAILRAAYPRFYANQSREDVQAAVNLWTMMFAEDDASLVMDAVRAFIKSDTKGFPPVIGQISEKLRNIQRASFGEEMSATEAWAMVSKAMKNSAYNAAEEFEKLPEIIRSVIGGPSQLHDWATCEDGVSQSVVASQFQKAYSARIGERKEIQSYPMDVQRRIEQDRRLALGDNAPSLLASPMHDDLDDWMKNTPPEERRRQLIEMTKKSEINFFEDEDEEG